VYIRGQRVYSMGRVLGDAESIAGPFLSYKASGGGTMIRKLASGGYRLYSRKINPRTGRRRNLGTFGTRAAAEKHERAVQFFKRK
jgi:hypothetical protein